MIIPKELDFIIKKQNDKRIVNRILKVYEGLLYKKGINKTWFDAPSSYLKKINGQYNKVMPLLIEYGIIEYKTSGKDYKWKDLFTSDPYDKKSYFPTQSMKYRFLIDVEDGYKYDIEVPQNLYDSEKWYIKTSYSLMQLGFAPDELIIKRDNFSRRLHTNITGTVEGAISYRNLLDGGDYFAIDSKTSQPRLLWLIMKEAGLNDYNLNKIFENDLDFYEYIIGRIPAINNGTKKENRVEAKELFSSWVNGTGYLDEEKVAIRDIFKVANIFIRNYKTTSYKNICRLLQGKEASIFIDDLLNNVPVKFCLSVHDSLIVKKEDVEVVLKYCKTNRPELIFNVEEIIKKYK